MNYRTLPEEELDILELGSESDFQQGVRWMLEIDRIPVALFRVGKQYFAIQDLCTHDGGTLGEGNLLGKQVECPRHGARFDLETGRALRLPAIKEIDAFPVLLKEGKIFIGMPKHRPGKT